LVYKYIIDRYKKWEGSFGYSAVIRCKSWTNFKTL